MGWYKIPYLLALSALQHSTALIVACIRYDQVLFLSVSPACQERREKVL